MFSFFTSVNAQKILFVGNSLTYSNNLPDILEDIANKSGIEIKTKSLCFANYAIADHLNEGKLHKTLSKKKYDYVVVQQGPSSQLEGKKMLIDDGRILKKVCDKYNTKLVYFMVWTSKKWYHTLDLVIENHKIAAKQNNALLFPVGKVWKEYNKHKNVEYLYSLDGFHPSKAGSFLAALTMFHRLYPKENLHLLKFPDYKKWIKNEDSFKLIIKLIEDN
ncbi:SGNH/GDSL hydrolase family protein [Polaribacter sp. SA4-12]|uniref:SGNH/GDSL hydrolase family protein n=1 Tax=Polaribacter sp. SA4-12 TaxID=1312072 RepID=UPI001E3AE08E|nr:SGNH/GDSL hydrolase family protein [Polaribacter sp. SA4-12]